MTMMGLDRSNFLQRFQSNKIIKTPNIILKLISKCHKLMLNLGLDRQKREAREKRKKMRKKRE
jgi:hypothetical protein